MVDGIRTRILVVDDSKDTADSLAMILGVWGHHAEACYRGGVALLTARTFQPHVVLLDIAMPGMDGFQVARRLREQPESRNAVLMALTGCTDEAYRSLAWELGFSKYLLKPTDLDELRDLLFDDALAEAGFLPPQGGVPQYESVAEGQEATCW